MTQYEGQLAANYGAGKHLGNWMNQLTYLTFLKHLGHVQGWDVLDLACGSGYVSRLIAMHGARVLGVDISQEMIDMAICAEQGVTDRPSINYMVADAASLNLGRQFNMVCPSFLFHYAKSKDEMLAMMRTAFEHLRPGGRLLGLNAWDSIVPNIPFAGHWSEWADPQDTDREGAKVRLHILDGDDQVSSTIEYYHWLPATYRQLLEQAGFANVRFVRHRLPKEWRREFRAEYMNFDRKRIERLNASCVLIAERPN